MGRGEGGSGFRGGRDGELCRDSDLTEGILNVFGLNEDLLNVCDFGLGMRDGDGGSDCDFCLSDSVLYRELNESALCMEMPEVCCGAKGLVFLFLLLIRYVFLLLSLL